MAREVSTNGRKKVETLMKEFNANFPYLRLKVCPPEMKAIVAKGGTITGVNRSNTLSNVRTKKGGGEISFSGRKNVGTIEREFDENFGLYVQICYTEKDGSRHYTSGGEDKKSLTELNREKEVDGCKKGEWK